MRIIAAYLLAVLGGKQNPDAAAVKKILSSVSIEASDDDINRVITALNGKDIDQLIKEGKEKLASVPTGGGGGAAPAAAAGGAAPAAGKKEDVKEKEKEKEPEEEEADMGFSLFD